MSSFTFTAHGSLLVASFHRPEARNAINFEAMDGLELLTERAADYSVVLFTCPDKYFVCGGDLREFHAIHTADEARKMARRMTALFSRWEDSKTLFIAAINGDAYGGGCELALAMDLRVIASHAQMGFTQGRFALPPGWGGLTRLVEKVGPSKALLWQSAQSRVSASQALHAGLVDEIFPTASFAEDAQKLAKKISTTPRELLHTLKSGITRASEDKRSASLDSELQLFCEHWISADHQAAVEAFLNRSRRS